jgi:hypothetical protein
MDENCTQESNDSSFDRIKIEDKIYFIHQWICCAIFQFKNWLVFLTFESFSNVESIDWFFASTENFL